MSESQVAALPKGWTESTLGQVCDVITDGTHFTPRYVTRGVPFYSVESITNDDFVNVKYISVEEHRALVRRCRPQRDDILMTRIGSLADTKLIDWDVQASIYVSLALLRPGKAVDARYLYAFTKSRQFVKAVEDRSLLWAIPKKINMGDIAHVPVLIPTDRAEQRAIGDAILQTERHVKALEQLIAKKQAIMQGLMQQLLTGRTRLPGFTARWTDAALGGVASVNMGQSPVGFSYNTTGQGMPLVQGNADIRERRTVDRIWTTQPTKRCEAGDVLLTVRAPVGYTAIATKASCLGRGVCSVSAKSDNRFLFQALLYAEPNWSVYEQGSTFTAVNSNEVRSFRIAWPSDQLERHAIADTLDLADSEIAALQRRIAKAKAIKQGMMQELLSGRTRLPVQEATS